MPAEINLRPNSLPTVGAAFSLRDLSEIDGLRDFIFEGARDVELQDFISVDVLRTDWQSVAEAGTKAFDGFSGRVGIHGPFLGFALDTPDPDVRAIAKRRLDAALDACAKIAGPRSGGHVVVHSPFTTWNWYNRGTRAGYIEHKVELVHACLGDAVRKAEDLGLVIVIENIEDKDPAERVELARSFDSPAVKVSLDTGHAHYAFGATGAPPVDAYVRAAGNMLTHVHLQDTDAVADRHWAIGDGTIHWHAAFKALGELAEMPRLIIELNDSREILRSARWLSDQGLAI